MDVSPGQGVSLQGSYCLCWERSRVPSFALPHPSRGCLHVVCASCVPAVGHCLLALCGGPSSLPCTGDSKGPHASSTMASRLHLHSLPAQAPSVCWKAPRRWHINIQLPAPQMDHREPPAGCCPSLPPHISSPAHKLQACGPCLGPDSECGRVEPTSWTLTQKLTGLSGSLHWPLCGCCSWDLGARRGPEAWPSSPPCLPLHTHPSLEFREGCEKWGLVMGSIGAFPHLHEPQS